MEREKFWFARIMIIDAVVSSIEMTCLLPPLLARLPFHTITNTLTR